MDVVPGNPWAEVFSEILRRTQYSQFDDLMDVVNDITAKLPLHVRCYLVDEEQTQLWPMPQADEGTAAPIAIRGTMAGRTFITLTATSALPDTVWLPLLDGTERMGVLEVSGPAAQEPETQQRCRDLSILVAHLIAVGTRYADLAHQIRRSRPMSTGSELLQAMLPPLTFTTRRISIAAILQPFYEMSGDAFDYAVDGAYAHFCLVDAIGHGLASANMAATALSAMRSARRDNRGMYAMGRAVDEVLEREFGRSAFVTALLCRLDLESGRLRYINAGHFPPVLFRRNKAVRELEGGRRLPLGLDDSQIEVAEHSLEHEDTLLLYSDGVIEARDGDGEMFGIDRLTAVVEHAMAAALPSAEVMRSAARSVVDFSQDGRLRDDATLMLVQWSRDARTRMRPQLPG